MSFEVRFQKIGEDSVEKLSDMARFTFCDTFRHYSEDDLNEYLKSSLSVEALRPKLNDSRNGYYFVNLNGHSTGYLKWISPSTQYLEDLQVSYDRALQLERFYFLPEYCGKGLAAIALAFVESYARYQAGADLLYLSVWEKNFRAQRFYQKHGFRSLSSFQYPVGDVVDLEFLYGKRLGT